MSAAQPIRIRIRIRIGLGLGVGVEYALLAFQVAGADFSSTGCRTQDAGRMACCVNAL
jgi:hypothetical protein